MTLLPWLFVVFVVIPTTLWMALALYFHQRPWWLRWMAALAPAAIVGASLAYLPLWPWAVAVWLGLLTITLLWWFSLRPKLDRDWAVGLDVLPRVEIDGDALRIRNFRNFNYTEDGEPIPRYEERTFDLAQLSSVDYFLSHWSGPLMAHTLATFSFGDDQFLCLSVEARRQRWQSYSPLRGMFRAYELMFVVGDERDIVWVRTNVRRERVYMYRIHMPRENLRRLLLDYLDRAEKLVTTPAWYNSVTSNCTTNLVYHRYSKAPWWTRPHIFLNGLSARAMYRLGLLDTSIPFSELQSRCAIRERALTAGDSPDFSRQIRNLSA